MSRLKVAYAMMLAVIYMAATAMSSLSIFVCDHDHLHHSAAEVAGEHKCSCHCHHAPEAGETISCGHHHDLFGDNLTEFIGHGERYARIYDTATDFTDYAIVAVAGIDIAPATITISATDIGYEAAPPRAALVAHETLRAPPYKA